MKMHAYSLEGFGFDTRKIEKERRMHPKKMYSLLMYFCGTSITFIVTGILSLCLWSNIYEYIMRDNLVLKPNSTAYHMWVKNPVPVSLKLFVFNWTNPEDIYNSAIKPKFQELGPYYFTETKEKSNIVWNSNNNTVSYNNLKKWYFEPSLSNGSLSDTVTSIDPVALSAVYATRNWNYIVKKSLSGTLLGLVQSVAISHTVGQVFFEGYEDPLLQTASKLSFFHSSIPTMEKFGWFYGRNGSTDFEGNFNIDTGVSGQIGQQYTWKYLNHTPYYPDSCGTLKEISAGEFFPTNLRKDSIIKFFSADMCRYVELEFEKEVTVNGLLGYKYSAGDRFLDNGTKVPENKCFCDGDCMPSGALNVSACRFGSPAFVSLPHFFKADPFYVSSVDGLTPNENRHDFYMIFEPKTGVPLEVAARLQLNLRVQEVQGYRLYSGLPTIYIPILWFEQVVTMPDSMTFSIKILVNFPVIFCAMGIVSISIGLLVQVCMWYKICTLKLFGMKKSKEEKDRNIQPYESVPLNQKIA